MEHIRFTKQLKIFYQLKNHFSKFCPLEPKFYDVNIEKNKAIELYMNKLKRNLTVLASTEKLTIQQNVIRIMPNKKLSKSSIYTEILLEDSTVPDIIAVNNPEFVSSANLKFWKPHIITINDQESTNLDVKNTLCSELDIQYVEETPSRKQLLRN